MRSRSSLPLLLATVLVLRALVPVGYMVQLANAGDSFDFALVLCPDQNPELDLLQRAATDMPAQPHHHLHPTTTFNEHDERTLSVSGDCALWVQSSFNLAWLNGTSQLEFRAPPLPTTIPLPIRHTATLLRSQAQPRAPPYLV